MKALKKTLRIIGILFGILVLLIAALALYHQFALKAEADRILPNGQMIDLGDHRVHVYTEGTSQAAPALVLLSGSATVAPVYDFKPLYSLLSDQYRIAVVEKAGYGYSDIVEIDRNVDAMVNEVRKALQGAEIEPPYVLVPHSMSGLEALYWAQQFPDEVAGIVGLDMAIPSFYDELDMDNVRKMTFWGGLSVKLGLIRIPGIYPLNDTGLTPEERRQQKLLAYRNALNIDYLLEIDAVSENAQIVKAGGAVSCPLLLFCSDGTEIGTSWIADQEKFAENNGAALLKLDCGHYLHYYKSREIAAGIKSFLDRIAA